MHHGTKSLQARNAKSPSKFIRISYQRMNCITSSDKADAARQCRFRQETCLAGILMNNQGDELRGACVEICFQVCDINFEQENLFGHLMDRPFQQWPTSKSGTIFGMTSCRAQSLSSTCARSVLDIAPVHKPNHLLLRPFTTWYSCSCEFKWNTWVLGCIHETCTIDDQVSWCSVQAVRK